MCNLKALYGIITDELKADDKDIEGYPKELVNALLAVKKIADNCDKPYRVVSIGKDDEKIDPKRFKTMVEADKEQTLRVQAWRTGLHAIEGLLVNGEWTMVIPKKLAG